jgi:23S rRNA (guanine2445-N2)-methyltransferase / 23S rRNA (guanine2069-N7)-methyltransferase
MNSTQTIFATTARGMEPILASELSRLGAETVAPSRSGVSFEGTMEMAYKACLWSCFASRVLLPLSRFPARTTDELYNGVRGIDWLLHLAADGTIAVDCHAVESQIDHTHFASLKVKDAIVDQMREAVGVRPSVELQRPDLRVNLYLYRDEGTVSIDLAGDGLHKRGYRLDGGEAPLKESLAAAILARADWLSISADGGGLVDPMCGSGTLCIEAALMAADIAPGLKREYFGFKRWKGFEPGLWQALVSDAQRRRVAGLEGLPPVVGFDLDPAAVRIARANVDRAGLTGKIQIEQCDMSAVRPPEGSPGLLAVNPPYGERLGEQRKLEHLYAGLGRTVKEHFADWQAAVFTGNPKLASALRLRPRRSFSFYNGPIKCRLLCFNIAPAASRKDLETEAGETALGAAKRGVQTETSSNPSSGPEMLANRLRKNLRTAGRWARREGITCYRLYDADLPEYAFAVDLYHNEERWVHVQEYEPPSSIDPSSAERRRKEGLLTIAEVLQVPESRLLFKTRRHQKGKSQYEKLGTRASFFEVSESGCRFWVNLSDYLDTGLFLDQRLTRQLIRERIGSGRFLNLFGYTGSATVYAAAGGASTTTTVDMSTTYLDWARRNLQLNNNVSSNHLLVRADCLTWLDDESATSAGSYDLIWLDPPTFSNSKRMNREFDLQRDYVDLIGRTANLLSPGGVLLFSTNSRRFKIDEAVLKSFRFKDISSPTLPKDFTRRKRMHHCWEITRG